MTARKLHAYLSCDGLRQYLVAAASLKEAARLLNTTVYDLRNYGGRLSDEGASYDLALSAPGQIFQRDAGMGGAREWVPKAAECPS